MSTSTPWRGSIDDTLRSTQETLARLNDRHNDFDHAKRRLAEAFTEETPYLYGRNGRESPDVRRDVPPPLPSSYINSLRCPPTAAGASAKPLYVNDSYQSESPNRRYNGNDSNSVPRIIKDLSEDYILVKSQLKNAQVELELERSVRADQVKSLEAKFTNHVGELRACVQQLRDDNTYLREALRATESHRALDGFGAADTAAATKTQGGYDEAKKRFMLSESLSPTVYERLTVVEQDVAKQQRAYEDRQGRLESLMLTTVKNKVEVEVERMRSIAREAARDGCEELIRLRLSAVQQMFGDELRRVMENTGVSREIAETTKELFRKMEGELERKVFNLEGQIADLRKETQVAGQKQKADLQHVLDNELHQVKQDVLTTQSEQRESALRLAQTTSAKVDAAKVDLLAQLTAAMEERQGSAAPVREADVRRLIDSAVAPLDHAVQGAQSSVDKVRAATEAAQKQSKFQLDQIQKTTNALHDDVYDCKTLVKDHGEVQAALREELNVSKAKLKEASVVLQQTADTAKDTKALLAATERAHDERLLALESQLRPVRAEQEAMTRKVSQVTNAAAVLEERTAACESKLIDVDASLTRATQPLKVKIESLQSLVTTKIQPAVDDLAVFPVTVGETLASLNSTIAYQEKLSAQRTSDAVRDGDVKLKELESALRREVQEASQQVLLQREAVDKKVLGVRDEMKFIWDRIGTGGGTLASREDVDRAIAEVKAKLQAVSSAVDAEMQTVREGLQNQTPARQQSSAAEAGATSSSPPTAAAMSPLKTERLDLLSNEIESLRDMVLQQAQSAHETARRLQESLQAEQEEKRAHAETAWRQALAESVQKLQDEGKASFDKLKKEVHAAQAALEERVAEEAEQRPQALRSLVASKLTSVAVVQLLLQSSDDDMKSLAARVAPAVAPLVATPKANTAVEDGESLRELKRTVLKMEQQQANMRKDQEDLDEEAKSHADDIEREKKTNQQRWRQLQERVAHLEEELARHDVAIAKDLVPLKSELEEHHAESAARVAALEERLKEAERTVAVAEAQCRDLSASHQTAVSPAVNEKIRVLLDTLAGEQESQLQPLRLKLRGFEERQRQLDSEYAELSSTVSAQGRELEKRWQAQLDKTREEATSHCGLLCEALEGRTQARQLEKEKSLLDRMQATVAPLQDRLDIISEPLQAMRRDVETLRQRLEERATLVPTATSTGADSSDVHEAIHALQERQVALEKWTEYIESTASEGLQTTGDALRVLRDGLHACISRVAAEANVGRLDHTHGCESSAAIAGGDRSMQSLGDILHYFLEGIRTLQHATATLSSNAMSTLSMLAHLQQEVLPVPHLQRAVVHIGSQLAPIAAAGGVDPHIFDVSVGPIAHEDDGATQQQERIM